MRNHLKDQTSPYLLQHADNPVDWYPWGEEAFARAKAEDKPVFLSIGYSTCHWCHVMAHESFEDRRIAELLNRYFISVKVDKEERPDIDSIYMRVCQAMTGSGGWPTTIFLTPEQKPFFAGTYFPKTARYGQVGLGELLTAIHEKWEADRGTLFQSADRIVAYLAQEAAERAETGNGTVRNTAAGGAEERDAAAGDAAGRMPGAGEASDRGDFLIRSAVRFFKESFDERHGGFGSAPKFPSPHNLLFLMNYSAKSMDKEAMWMVEKTLRQMYRGGLFDHIGGGFCRYSTDAYFLAPHFEKMLYDNALLILACCKACEMTEDRLYLRIAEKTAAYILREMTGPKGGFYSAQDADSEGVEGKYYLFEPSETVQILGRKNGVEFNEYYDITESGNFEGRSIPNLLHAAVLSDRFEAYLPALYEYRRYRYALHLDDKILTSWNGLMIGAMCHLYRISKERKYLIAARKAQAFLMEALCEGDTLYVSFRDGKRGVKGFLEDYANAIFGLLALYEATLEKPYLKQAEIFLEKVLAEFYDERRGGFYLYGKENEALILCPKETYDGAMPSGNSMMAYNLVRFFFLTGEKRFEELAKRQIDFMCAEAGRYPAGYAMFLQALSDFMDSPEKITVAVKDRRDLEDLPCRVSLSAAVCVLEEPAEGYLLKNDKTTYYVCREHSCMPGVNELG